MSEANAPERGALTATGMLPIGVVVDGVLHRDFTLRLPTVRDNIEATDEVGTTNGVAMSAALMARQLVALGTLTREQLTFDLVADMHPRDYNALDTAAAALEKKLLAAAAAEPTPGA